MQQDIQQLLNKVLTSIQEVGSTDKLYDLKVQVLGKSGELTSILKGLRELTPAQKSEIGKIVNDAKAKLEQAFDARQIELKHQETTALLKSQAVDISIDKHLRQIGNFHPLSITRNRIVNWFVGLGFVVHESPEIDTEYYNFQALNVLDDHPARDMQDTFFVGDGVLLRSHTSNGQIRAMESIKPPLKILSPGTVYRADNIDATHSPMFHQIEGLVVDKGLTMGDLKGILSLFAKFVFGEKTEIRLRPSYFPFTEPSVEVDASCNCKSGCKICRGTGWIEILGAGMVNQKVLSNCGINPSRFSGFAFGMGLERINNIVYGITDIRHLYENDLRFLRQFVV
ncbi:MAG: phenylalanine--tRNA ligase subunit alpha [Firmicutes bacterium]|nr:phenylalanine--tRNA ligase subunit alpha [Bacillota bacterium]MCL1954080.1 phenylalanine--tRNA ligase subunit alpha [Bacillota bacterium]